MMNFFKLFFAGSLLLSISCGDQEDPDLINRRNLAGTSDLGKPWALAEIHIEKLGKLVPSECLADNNYTYYPDGTFEMNEGVRKCDPNDPVGFSGQWLLDDAQKFLTIQLGDSVIIWEIDELTSFRHTISSEIDGFYRTYTFEAL